MLYLVYLPIYFGVVSLALGQSHNCPQCPCTNTERCVYHLTLTDEYPCHICHRSFLHYQIQNLEWDRLWFWTSYRQLDEWNENRTDIWQGDSPKHLAKCQNRDVGHRFEICLASPQRCCSGASRISARQVTYKSCGFECCFIETEWRIYASANYAIIRSDNVLLFDHMLLVKNWITICQSSVVTG